MKIEDYTREPLTRGEKIRLVVISLLLSILVGELAWLSILVSRLMN